MCHHAKGPFAPRRSGPSKGEPRPGAPPEPAGSKDPGRDSETGPVVGGEQAFLAERIQGGLQNITHSGILQVDRIPQ